MIGDIIYFGRYPRSLLKDKSIASKIKPDDFGRASCAGVDYFFDEGEWYLIEPIAFVVIGEEEEAMQLMSVECIDATYYAECIVARYDKSYLKEWVEHDFPRKAFSPEEQKRIIAIGVPDCFSLKALPEAFKACPISDYARRETSSTTYWTSEIRYNPWSGSFQDTEPHPDEAVIVDADGPFPADTTMHSTGLLDYDLPVRIYLRIKR